MFNGNTFADLATLDEILDLVDYDARPCGFLRKAVIAHEDWHEATFGTDPGDELRIAMAKHRIFLEGLGYFQADLQKFYDEALAWIAEENRKAQTPYKKTKIDGELRKFVFERDAYRCRHCGGWKDLSVDHIFPERFGGTLDPANLQTLCRSCNSRKGTRHDGATDAQAAD